MNQNILIDDLKKEKLCKKVFSIVDSNNDGFIGYGEFQDFMVHLSRLTGRDNISQEAVAEAYDLLANLEDGNITYNELKGLIGKFIYILNTNRETTEDFKGTLPDDPYVLKKMIKDLKK